MTLAANTIEEFPIIDGNIFVDHVVNAILAIRKNSKRPDNIAIYQFINDKMPTNITQGYIDQLLTIMIDDNIIYNKTTSKGPSFFKDCSLSQMYFE